jgi:periplasmic copper chaperone A
MKKLVTPKLIATWAVFTWATASFGSVLAHVVLQDAAAAAGASYRATFKVGHGCDGAPTTGIRVSIPAGFNGAQPMPKPGWTITAKRGALATPYQSHGKTFTEGVVEITWTANGPENALPADFYDEFVLRGTPPTQPGPLWFKVVQTCGKAENAWVEIPVTGTATRGLKSPAALLEVLDIQAASHAH